MMTRKSRERSNEASIMSSRMSVWAAMIQENHTVSFPSRTDPRMGRTNEVRTKWESPRAALAIGQMDGGFPSK